MEGRAWKVRSLFNDTLKNNISRMYIGMLVDVLFSTLSTNRSTNIPIPTNISLKSDLTGLSLKFLSPNPPLRNPFTSRYHMKRRS